MTPSREKPALAYVAHSLNPGGTERLVADMALAFAADHRVEVFCLDEPGTWARDVRRQGVPVHGLWRVPGFDAALPWRLARGLRAMRADIVHAHQCTPWFYAALARLAYPAPRLLLEEHGRFYPEVDSPRRRFVHRVVTRRLTHRFVAVSQDVRARLARYEGLDAARIEVVFNGSHAPRLLDPAERAARRAALGFGPEHIVVGTVGRFDPIKNLPMLVRGVAGAAGSVSGVRGLLVGDGPVFGEILALVERSGLAGKVRFTGFREDARELVQCMDLFVLSSFSEGISMALLEAAAAGVPAAVTAVGGNPDVVVADETGWIVPSDAPDALAQAILDAAADAAKRERFSVAARQRFRAEFTFERMLERYRNIYSELLDHEAARGSAARTAAP